MNTRKMVLLSILTSLALIISLIEQSMPLPLGVPGAKLGLSNLVILLSIVIYGAKSGMIVALLKSVLLLLITGSVTGFWYSILGALFASAVMGFSHRYWMPPFSLIGISELGALAHNVGQLSVAAIVLENRAVFVYLPVLTLVGIFSGFFVGLSANLLAPHLRRASDSAIKRRAYGEQTKHDTDPGDAGRRSSDGEDDSLGRGRFIQ